MTAMQTQLNALLEQIKLLTAQSQTQTAVQQQTQTTLQQTQQNVQQIQQNTTTPPPPPTASVDTTKSTLASEPEVKKEVFIGPEGSCQPHPVYGTRCLLKVTYFENGVRKNAVGKIQSNDGIFYYSGWRGATVDIEIKYYNAPDQLPYGFLDFYPDGKNAQDYLFCSNESEPACHGKMVYYSVTAMVNGVSYIYSSRTRFYPPQE